MKRTREHMKTIGRMAGFIGIIGVLWSSAGCIIVSDAQTPYYNSLPYIGDIYVDCFWDGTYGYYGWDFSAYVDDGDGYSDVSDVYVEVFDVSYGYLESWDLVYDGSGWWSNLVYENYSDNLFCEDLLYYEFDFYAYDYYGDSDSVTYIP